MIFPYLRITSKIIRPVIPVLLTSKEKFVIYPALVDSGSDYCVFSRELVDVLGIKLDEKTTAEIQGIGKGMTKGYMGTVNARVRNTNFRIKAIFADIGEFGHGILGQKGFFDIFVVKFDLVKEEVELKAR